MEIDCIAALTSWISISSEKLSPIIVPPLKSIPRFNPDNSINRDKTKQTEDTINPTFLAAIKLILVFFSISILNA